MWLIQIQNIVQGFTVVIMIKHTTYAAQVSEVWTECANVNAGRGVLGDTNPTRAAGEFDQLMRDPQKHNWLEIVVDWM